MVFPPEADRLGRGLFSFCVCVCFLFVCVCVVFCVFFFVVFVGGVRGFRVQGCANRALFHSPLILKVSPAAAQDHPRLSLYVLSGPQGVGPSLATNLRQKSKTLPLTLKNPPFSGLKQRNQNENPKRGSSRMYRVQVNPAENGHRTQQSR